LAGTLKRLMESIINNSSGMRIERAFIKNLMKRFHKKKWIVSISFVRKAEMRKLNRTYRKKDKPTDVLSFSMKEGRLLGDVIICPEVAKLSAKKYGSSFRAELARLTVHGILHLLGYDHGKKMFDLQEKLTEGANA
jgi:rRNA maturation RNase YbeY